MKERQNILTAHELYRFYHTGDDETAALRGVSLAIVRDEMVAVMGPSGSGKSTLLSCLTGLDEPDGGYVCVNGRRISRRPENRRSAIRARAFGILPQSGNLIGQLSVRGNIRLQCAIAGVGVDHVDALIRSVGLERRADALPGELSGGETARAGLAVAMAAAPPVLIADEPTAEVDESTESQILEIFAARRRAGLATVLSTHSEALAEHADRILRLHDGKLVNV
ncbi:ABC transporter ATP-binding protein [Varunaivibrio sulfuroxidans]|uniref:Putative ABC transport system ATP-binding protein n=1 Tax=Varunaivibrio sulfuroxidans TaxID=1773489 RepID=A0A4R3JAH1_9PROT|nr:ATP-binding cassette domain-containing protein [Varunaivibrio sulfuroxidans]TCS62979.1 putative ABC transport system ATP-binding protein [Varunaivibrio sulfuroxidans]WES31943.1 ATP-binding cassette domain-containing protein [Varunaivibrio sulfuroxidans]